MKILTKEEILAAEDIPTQVVDVPAWGGAVRVAGMSLGKRNEMMRKIKGKDGEIDPEKASLEAFVTGVVEPKFTREDFDALRQKSASAIDDVTKVFLELSGVGEDATESAEKNS